MQKKSFPSGTALLTTLILTLAPALTVHAVQCDCSQPISNGAAPTATDCLKLLNVAVGIGDCSPCGSCACRPNGGPVTTATDALLCLNAAVGQPVQLRCPCGGTTTTTLIPKEVSGDWTLAISEVSENCGEGLGPTLILPIALSQDSSGNVTLLSPTPAQLGISNLQMDIVGCRLIVSYHEDDDGERTCYDGVIDIDANSSSFNGLLSWSFVGPPGTSCQSSALCSGTDRWVGSRN